MTLGFLFMGPAGLTAKTGWNIEPILYYALSPIASLVLAGLVILLICICIRANEPFDISKKKHADEQASRVANMYAALTGEEKPKRIEIDYYFEPTPTRASDYYHEYDAMRQEIAAHVRAGNDRMSKSEQLAKYESLGGAKEDYLYESPAKIARVQAKRAKV